MYELRQSPSRWDAEGKAAVAGIDRVRLFPGAELALQELATQERFSDTQVAVASATTDKKYALKCLQLIEVS